MGFRAIDDIKDSVRKAGGGLTRSLSQMLVNSIKVESGSSETNAKEVLSKLLPFLLGTKGIQSDAEDVRDFSLETILKLVKRGEPQIINYLTLNADKYNLKHDDIDAKRLQSIGSSPMMNALERLIDLIDDDIIGDVVVKIQSTVKKSVGLPSKAAASRLFVTLVVRHLQLLKPYGEVLLNTCISQLNDRNTTVSSSFATAAGYVCRVCSVDVVAKYGEKIQASYFESEDEKSKIVAGVASEAVSKYSGDRFASVASAFLPVAFVAKNDANKEVAKNFESEWTENTSGNGAVKLYIHEICALVKQYITSPQFSVRQTSAKSIAEACNAIDGATVMNIMNLKMMMKIWKKMNTRPLMQNLPQKNLTREAQRMKALSSLVKSFQIYPDKTYHPELLEFTLKALEGTINSNVIIPTWRSQIAVDEGLTKIAEVLKGASNIDSNNVDLLIKTWEIIFKNNTKTEDVENVKIQTVRAGKALIGLKNENIKYKVVDALKALGAIEPSSVIKVEIGNALA
ncbi:unnamed protein product [Wickerhamomyces anomalus]